MPHAEISRTVALRGERTDMYRFLLHNRNELIARCEAKVAKRPHRSGTDTPLANGIPLFLDQLTRTFLAEDDGDAARSLQISGASGGDAAMLSEMGLGAAAHGRELLQLGFSVDQVVHAYGDLCQSITDLAFERQAPFTIDQFRTLNRCLDNAIADAVTAFAAHREAERTVQQSAEENERVGILVREVRDLLQVATFAFRALESGQLPVGGSTGGVLKRSLASISSLLLETMDTVRLVAPEQADSQRFEILSFVEDAVNAVSLEAAGRGCSITVGQPSQVFNVRGNRAHLMAALVNVLQNAVTFTHPGTDVSVELAQSADTVTISVADRCGGLPAGLIATLSKPFTRSGAQRSGVGLGLSSARKSIHAAGGTVRAAEVPGIGCVFTIALPLVLPL